MFDRDPEKERDYDLLFMRSMWELVSAPFTIGGALIGLAADAAKDKRKRAQEEREWEAYLRPTALEKLKYAEPFPDTESFMVNVARGLVKSYRTPRPDIFADLMGALGPIYDVENLHDPTAEQHDSLALDLRVKQFQHREETLKRITDAFTKSYEGMLKHIPESLYGEETKAQITIPLKSVVNVRQMFLDMLRPLYAPEIIEWGLFREFHTFMKEQCKDADPTTFKGDDDAFIKTYMGNTGFEDIYEIPVPLVVPRNVTFEHTHILAGSGHGKTTALTARFIEHVQDLEQPAVIVIDGKGTWAKELQRFKMFVGDDRLLVINPQDLDYPAALNMFALPQSIPEKSKEVMRDAIAENLSYVFGSREFDLSAKQDTAFSYAARIVFAMPGGSIETLRALMQDPVADPKMGGIRRDSPFYPYIMALDETDRQFMTDMFYHASEYMETRRQIQNRIYNLISSKPFAAMFKQKENRLDMFDVLQSGKIVIIDSSPGALSEKAAQTFGRYILALTLASARARINVSRASWRSSYVLVDEAQMFVDEERTQPLLQQAREFNVGVTLAHQKLDDLTPKLRATLANNTSSKYVGGVGYDDARKLAQEIHCDPDFIREQGKGEFAVSIRGVTKKPISVKFPLGILDNTPKMTDVQHAQLLGVNAFRLAARNEPEPAPVVAPEPKPAPTAPPPVAEAEEPPKPPEKPGRRW